MNDNFFIFSPVSINFKKALISGALLTKEQ
jgi:hypothetical protein